MAFLVVDVSPGTLGPSEPSVIKANCLYSLLRKIMSNMRPMVNVWIVPMEHKNNCLALTRGWIPICSQLELLSFLRGDIKFNEVKLGEAMLTLRVDRELTILLCISNHLYSATLGHRKVVPVLIKLTTHFLINITGLIFNSTTINPIEILIKNKKMLISIKITLILQ